MEFAWIKEHISIIKGRIQYQQLAFYDKTEKKPTQPPQTITFAGSAGGVKNCTCSYVPRLAPLAKENKMDEVYTRFLTAPLAVTF